MVRIDPSTSPYEKKPVPFARNRQYTVQKVPADKKMTAGQSVQGWKELKKAMYSGFCQTGPCRFQAMRM